MTYQIPQLQFPELKISSDKYLIDVPSGQACASIELCKKEKASGFFFNAYRGCDQATLDAVLRQSKPIIVGVAGFDHLDYSEIYRNKAIRKLILGNRSPWPNFQALAGLKAFSTISFENRLDELPLRLEELDVYSATFLNLSSLTRLKRLKKLRITLSSVVDLTGIPAGVKDLELNHCRKLKSIDAIEHCKLNRLLLDDCKKIESLQVLANQNELESLTIANMGTISTLSFAQEMQSLIHLKVIKTTIADR